MDIEKVKAAVEFSRSLRGQFIISQALAIAIKQLESVQGPEREVSNINDMKYLRDTLYPLFMEIPKEELERLMRLAKEVTT